MPEPDFQIRGGAGGVDARLDDLVTLAQGSEDLGSALGSITTRCHAMLVDPDVLASALLNPGGVARFEAELLGALDGRGGLTALSVGFQEHAVALRVSAASYRAVDAASADALDAVRWLGGYAAAGTLPAIAVAAGIPLGGYLLAGGEIDVDRLLTDHPGLVDTAVGAGPGLVSALPGMFAADVPAAAHLVGLLYPDGTPWVSDDQPRLVDPTPPAGFGDVLAGLDRTNSQVKGGDPDQIDIREIVHSDGTRSWIVDIPGTKQWPLPGQRSDDLHDLGTNVHVLAGEVTTRQEAIAEAMRRAGVRPDDPVMLVGHSQGGMVAAQAAHDSGTGAFDFNVTHVVTAGSPIGRVDIPDSVQVLALENRHDIVPHLDAAENPDRDNVVTVTFDDQRGSIGDNHGTGTAYLPAARSLDASTDPSIAAYRAGAGEFLGTDATRIVSHPFTMTRR